MRYLFLILAIMGTLMLTSEGLLAAEIYRWVDKNGNIFFSDSPPPYGSFKKQNIEDQINKSIDQRRELEKQSDIDKKEKLDEKIQLEFDYQKKAKAIRNYQIMREDLDALKEKYQKKLDNLNEELRRTWPGGARVDIYRDIEKLKREYEKEQKQIRNLYGYY